MDKPKFFRNKGTHYFKYLGTSLLILGVPILVISVYFNSRFLGRFREEVFETVDMELGQISLQLDNRIAQMRETASRLMIDGIISGARKAQDPYQLLPLISYLSILTSSNEWYEDIIINIFSCDYMVTSSTTWKKDLFWTFNFGPEKREFAKSMFGDDQSVNEWPVCVTSAEAGYIDRNVLFFILPLYSDYQIRYGSLIFRVKTSSMEKMISNRMISYNAAIMIQTPGGESIFTSGIIPDNTSSGFTARRYVSPETGWIYSAFLPDDQNAFDKVSSISREFMITVLLITIVCLVMIMLTQELLYAPIQNLGNKVRTVLPEDEGTKNEFSGISKALDILSTKNNTLESALATNMTDIKNSRIYRLLNGAYQSTSDFNTDNIDLGLPLKYGSVTVLIALVKAQKSDLAEYCESEKRRLRELYLFYYCMEVAANDRIVFIINHENRYEPQALAEELMSHAKMSGMVFTIGIGSTTDDLSKVGQSYIEASGALDLRYVKGSGRIIRSSEISGIDASALYPKGEMTALSNALSADNIDSSLQAMDRIMALVQGGELPVYLVRCIVSDMFTLINRTFSVSDDTTPVSIQLSKADDIQDVMTIAEKWKGRLRDVMSSRQKSESSMKEIRQYIDDNCLRPDFSAYETADRFGMTLPNLSRLFKEYSGQNLIDYTTAIRMETAKDLLSSTGLSVSEIAEKVGYYNLSSFTRRFKQSTGISPTEFRSLNNITN